MLNVSRNQHRWKQSLDGCIRAVLEKAGPRLKWAWKVDMEYPKSYPANTDYAFGEIKAQIRECQLQGRIEVKKGTGRLPPPPPPPECFSELIDDKTVRAVYEDQNVGSYKNALELAAKRDGSVFRKILNAVNTAYMIEYYGIELAPKPRVHFLHRNLLEIADLGQLSDLTHEGIAEFLDDLCPCGKTHKSDAIRKLRKRRTVLSQAKP
jgi:hypothetical protein